MMQYVFPGQFEEELKLARRERMKQLETAVREISEGYAKEVPAGRINALWQDLKAIEEIEKNAGFM